MTVLFILGNVKTRIFERNRFQNTVFTQTRWAEVDKVNNEMMLRRSDRKNGIEGEKHCKDGLCNNLNLTDRMVVDSDETHSEFQESFNIINVFLFYFFGTGVTGLGLWNLL
ncbi:hypothetical protein RhiirB3_434015 [Rhizophagus irregularis]|nr:hypothetical protein RhiirB3_434015 [Rhizophagus irregularis]